MWLRRSGWFAQAVAVLCIAALSARARDGEFEWAYYFNGGPVSASPAVEGNIIYIGTEGTGFGRVLAISSDGRTLWNRILPDRVSSSPMLGPDGKVYVGCYDRGLYAFDATTGSGGKLVTLAGAISGSPAIGGDGTIYVGSEGLDSGALYAIAADGRVKWSFPVGKSVQSSPAVAVDGTIYFGCDDHRVYALASDGTKKWDFVTGAPVYSSPAIGRDGTVYIGSRDHRMYALNPDGSKKWDWGTNDEIWSSPVLGASGAVYFASFDRFFYALNPADGSQLWKFEYGATTISSAAVRGDGAIIFGADDGIVRALKPDGTPLWSPYSTPFLDLIESSPMVASDGSIYIGSLDGRLYKLQGSGSPLSEYSSWPAFRRNAAHTARASTINGSASLKNLSTRAHVQAGSPLIAGFFVQGLGAKAYLVRGVGPALAQFGIAGFLPDPFLKVYDGENKLWGGNDDWQTAVSVADTAPVVGAFPFPSGSKDAAVVATLFPGPHTAHVTEVNGQPGIALVELYDAIGGDSATQFSNLATRGPVGTGANVMIMGLTISGSGPTRVLIRAVGPGLAQFGVGGVLQTPKMTVFDATAAPIFETTSSWSAQGLSYDLQAAAELVAAFPLPFGSQDRARVLTLNPGSYTVQISGVNNTTGEALAEIYVLP